MKYNFIIISDDPIYVGVTKRVINKLYPDSQTKSFDAHAGALDYIRQNNNPDTVTCVFIDIWLNNVVKYVDFIAEFEKIPEQDRNSFYLYVLSPSTIKKDMIEAQSKKLVEFYLIKPFTKETLGLIIQVLNKRLGLTQ